MGIERKVNNRLFTTILLKLKETYLGHITLVINQDLVFRKKKETRIFAFHTIFASLIR